MIGLWPSLVINIMVTFFQTQGIVLPGLIANVFGVAVTVLLNLLVIHGTGPFGSARWSGLGFIGAAVGTPSSSFPYRR